MYVAINRDWIIPSHDLCVHLHVVPATDKTINIFLPKYQNGKIIKITQNSNQDIRVHCNSNVWLESNESSYQCLIVTGADCNIGKTFQIVGRNKKWFADISKINSYTEKE